MQYINLLLLILLLSSCATTEHIDTENIVSSGQSPLEQSESEKLRYKNAVSLLNKGRLDAAKEIFIEFKQDRPELAGPYANLAVIALRNKNIAKAHQLVKLSLIRNPKLSQALNLVAYLEQLKGDIESAEQHYKEAIQSNNNNAIAHYNIALLYDVYLQDIGSAIPHYKKYMSLTGNKDKNTSDWLEQIKRTNEKG
ncbi:MAG: hypothetical protein QM484_06580 [Woeseiaceae bacterium]